MVGESRAYLIENIVGKMYLKIKFKYHFITDHN